MGRHSDRMTCEGGCHCGAVRFRARLSPKLDVLECECSICRMSGFLHVTVPHEHFELQSGKDELVEYWFHTRTARHLFCGRCGVKSFYQPRSHPDAWSLNLRCLELPPGVEVVIRPFQGSRWAEHIDSIRDSSN